jgi:hypothetical protein
MPEEAFYMFDNSDDFCYLCGSDEDDGNLMVCDLCDMKVCHTYCAGFEGLPEDDWFCDECKIIMEDGELFSEDSYYDSSDEYSEFPTPMPQDLYRHMPFTRGIFMTTYMRTGN